MSKSIQFYISSLIKYKNRFLRICSTAQTKLIVIMIGLFVFVTLKGSFAAPQQTIDSLRNQLTHTPDSVRVHTMVELAFAYSTTQPDSVKFWANQALQLALSLDDRVTIARCYFANALYHGLFSQYEEALRYYYQSLEIYEEEKHSQGMIACYNNIGGVYKKQKLYDKALEYYEKSLKINADKNQVNLADICNNIGNIHIDKKEYDAALEYYEKAKEAYLKLNNEEGLATIQNNLGLIEQKRGNFQSALPHYQEALKLFTRKDDYFGMITAYSNLAQTFAQLKRWVSAEKNFSLAMDLTNKVKSSEWRMKLYFYKSEMYNDKGNHKLALEYHKKFFQLNDSLYTSEKSKQLAQMQAKFETQQKNREIEQLQEKERVSKLKRNFLVLCLLIIILFTGILIHKQRKKIRKDEELRIKNQQIHEAQEALMAAKLKYKNNEVQNFAIHIIQKNEFIRNIKEHLSKIKQFANQENRDLLKKVNIQIQQNLQLSTDIELFQKKINRMNEDFFQHLENNYPSLTEKEKKLCALLKLNLSSKEIASLNNITERAVVMARYRLRKKFDLPQEDKLSDFLNKI